MDTWKATHIPNLAGKTAIVTGGNIGLGYQIALELARQNAKTVIACRTVEKGKKAIESIEKALGRNIQADVISLDLTDRLSIQNFAKNYQEKYNQLDILVNNAGVVNLSSRQETKDGREMHRATNHDGHFALTGFLLPSIQNTQNARVVTVFSGGYRFGTIDFDDLDWQKRPYNRTKSYGDSKLANVLFMLELDWRFKQHGYSALSVGAHPGLSATPRQQSMGVH